MTVGWKEILVDGKPAFVRICYVQAWDDSEWRKLNGLPPKELRRGGRPRKTTESSHR